MRRLSATRTAPPKALRTGGATPSRPASALGAAALALAMLAIGGPAGAAASGSQTNAPAPVNQPSLVAGYLAAPSGGLASASLRFKVPVVKCKADEVRAVAIGLGDVTDLESPQVRGHAMLRCPVGGPPEYEIGAQACSDVAGPLATKHGHEVSVAVAQSGGTVTVTVTDEKSGAMVSASDSTANCYPAGPVDALLFGAFPVFDPGLLEVPNFNKVKPRDATLNGAELSGEKVNRQTEPGIRTGKLREELSADLSAASRQSGDSYSLKYKRVVHCCAPAPAPSGLIGGAV